MNNRLSYYAGVAIFFLFVGFPFVAGILYALMYSTGLTGLLSKGFTGKHWSAVLHDASVLQSLAFSFYIALLSIGLATMITIVLLVYFEDSLVRERRSYRVYLPLCIPAIVSAFLSFQLLGKSGLFSRIAFRTHLISDAIGFPDLINDRFAIGIILTHILMALPFFVIYFSNLFTAARLKELSNVAATLGGSRRQIVRRLLVPILLRKGAPVLLLYFIFVTGSYEIPLLLGRQSPQMISLVVLRKVQRFNLQDLPQGYAIALIYVAVMLSILTLFFYFGKKEAV